VRAQQLTQDPWAEDPGCYLSDEEVAGRFSLTDGSAPAPSAPGAALARIPVQALHAAPTP
jgi:hypothetical protein